MPTGIKVNNIKLGYSQSLKNSGQGYQLFFDGVNTDDPNIYVDGTALQLINTETLNTSVKTVNNTSIIGTGNIVVLGLPQVSDADNGKMLMVTDGQWQLVYPSDLYPSQPDYLRIWVDDFPLDLQQEYDESHQELLANTINDTDNYHYSNIYVYTNTTVQMNGNTYYVWEWDTDDTEPYSYLLTTTADVNTLYNQSLVNNLANKFTAYVGRFSSDLDEIYDEASNMTGKMYLVYATTENDTPVIYVDDFARTFKEYSLYNLDKGANPYDFTGDTITYNGKTYYLWEMNTELAGGLSKHVQYFATTTVNFDTLYAQSIEDDPDNRFTSAIGMFDDSEEMYAKQGVQEDGTDRHYLLKVQRI